MRANNLFQLQGQNSHTATYGEKGDIPNICKFGWYKWVYARDGSEPFPYMTEILGVCLGPAKNEVNEMMQWILNINRQVLPRRYIRTLRPYELSKEAEIANRAVFDAAIKLIHGYSFTVTEKEFEPNPQYFWYEEDHPIPVPEADAVD